MSVESRVIREYVFGDYRVELAAYQLWLGNNPITLTPKVFDTLLVLIQRRDRAVSKDELLSLVWPDSSVTEDSLAQSISLLRKALGDDTTHPKLIATIPRRGYRFIGAITEVSASSPPLETESKTVSGAPLPALPLFEEVVAPGEPKFGTFATLSRANSVISKWKPWLGGALLGGIAVVAIGMALPQQFSWGRVVRQRSPTLRFSVGTPSGTSHLAGSVLSPDGRYLLLLTQDASSEIGRIWIRSLVSGQSWPISGTEGATRPFWSPDSRFVGFIYGGTLARVGINNQTPPQVITPIDTRTGGLTWSTNGLILFALRGAGLYSVPASGGVPVPVTTLNSKEQEISHRWPQFLPDGNHFLFLSESSKPDRSGTYLGSLQSKQVERVLNTPAIFAQPGYLIYPQDHLLRAQAFDPAHPHVRQEPMTIGELVFPGEGVDDPTLSTANLSVSANGLLAYIGGHSRSQVKSFDRSGRELTAVDMSTLLYSPALSPDQKQLLVANRDVNRGVWLVDLSRGVSTRIILDGRRSLWSPDGTRIVFDAERAGENSFFIRPTTGSNEDKPLLSTRYSKSLNDWSRDGRYILYTSYMPNTKNALWILPMFGEQRPKPFLQAPFNEMQGEISPDGHWVAYISDESGSWEVYLQSFPEPGRAQVISIGGGTEPHWRKDGKELFYLAPDHTLMTVPITLNSPPAIERPRALFRSPVFSMAGIVSNQFAVSADGQRFLFVAEEKTTKEVDQVTVLSSWPNLLTH